MNVYSSLLTREQRPKNSFYKSEKSYLLTNYSFYNNMMMNLTGNTNQVNFLF